MHTSHPFPGFLIAIEGIDGAGKSTLARHLGEQLQRRNFTVVQTREPTGSHWGQILRNSAQTGRLSPEEELEAFIKDRQEHVDAVIRPELKSGRVVVVDRYYFSTMAYQGARGFDPEEIRKRNEQFAPEPDLLVLLDLDPKHGLDRVLTRGERATQFEKMRTLTRAREIFLAIDKPYLLVADAALPPETTCATAMRRFDELAAARAHRLNHPTTTEQRRKI